MQLPDENNFSIEKLLAAIETAAKLVNEKYLNVITSSENSLIVRERVFCYELYHQIRKILEDDHFLTLNGEIDKHGHKKFKQIEQKNPDFVFHVQGNDQTNAIIMEVKGTLEKKGLKKDFETIHNFISEHQYHAGVFFLYNHSLKELAYKMKNTLTSFSDSNYSKQIFIISLPKSGFLEKSIRLSELKDIK